jgi:glutamate carboxypeptidase
MNAARNMPEIDPAEILADIKQWSGIESPSKDGVAVNRVVDVAEAAMAGLGMTITRRPGRDGYGDCVVARSPWGGDGPGILIMAHLDTVHPHGTLEGKLKLEERDGCLYGPGVYDMKGGACLGVAALRQLVRAGHETPLPITYLFTPDEEVGSPTSRDLIEEMGLANKYVLVLEPGRDGNKVVTARKGCARYLIRAHGRPSHAGMRHQDGVSAVLEAARQIAKIEALTDYETGVTANVGLWTGGSGANVRPALSEFEVDVRLPNDESAKAACAILDGLTPVDPEVRLEIEGGLNRPPYPKTPAIAALHAYAQSLAEKIGMTSLEDTATGGFSDGNFTAALGIPTLDGLGVDGDGAHTEDERLILASIKPRTELLIRLLESLD